MLELIGLIIVGIVIATLFLILVTPLSILLRINSAVIVLILTIIVLWIIFTYA